MNLFTAVILSPEPVIKTLPNTVDQVNYVSKFRAGWELTDLAVARRQSLELVKTPYMFLLDYDDEYEFMEVPTTGMVCGKDKIHSVGGGTHSMDAKHHSVAARRNNIMLSHHAVVYNTAALRAVYNRLPTGDHLLEWMASVVMAAWKKPELDERVQYTWTRGFTGMHKFLTQAHLDKSRQWLQRNLDSVVASLALEEQNAT